jgi:hypothetical protein
MAALRILESGVIPQATLTKIHPQLIPKLRAAIEDLSNGRTAECFEKWTTIRPPGRYNVVRCRPEGLEGNYARPRNPVLGHLGSLEGLGL